MQPHNSYIRKPHSDKWRPACQPLVRQTVSRRNAISLARQGISARKCRAVGKSSNRPGQRNGSSLAEFSSRQIILMTKVLLLGLGRWGVNHLRNLHAMPLELYVAEVDTKRLEPARKLG